MSADGRKGIVFSLKKTKGKPNFRRTNDVDQQDEDSKRDFVSSIDEKVIKSTVSKPEKRELVIPLIVNNNWRKRKTNDNALKKEKASKDDSNAVKTENAEDSLEDRARKELIREAEMENEEWEKRGAKESRRVIPLLLQNKVPDGFEADDNFDVSLRPDAPSLKDYEEVPIEEFGLAMLKGMGWKPGDPIGGINKAVVTPIEVNIRPKGLGLGAELPRSKQKRNDVKQDDLTLKIGCYVRVEMGPHSGHYGKVEGLDEDLSRAMVRLALPGTCVNVSTSLIMVVSSSEYHKEAKVINRTQYDEFKLKTEKKTSRRDRHY